eukprot:gene34054-41997_t
MSVGTFALADYRYIGGYEGASEFWWMRITADGKREQIGEPRSNAVSNTGERIQSSKQLDPRCYFLTEADIGCTLKAKCRPVRSDGAKGEIFTSKGSVEVVQRDVEPQDYTRVSESGSSEEMGSNFDNTSISHVSVNVSIASDEAL